jgi:hypothetical protein
MNLDEYYDDCIINTSWWLEHGSLNSDDDTPAELFYVYDLLVLGTATPVPNPEVVSSIIGFSNPMLVWITDREIIYVDPRQDKQIRSGTQVTELLRYVIESLCDKLGMNSTVLVEHAVVTDHFLSLVIEKESYTICASVVKFSFNMSDTLRMWKEAISAENNKSEDPNNPMEPA